MKRYAKPVFVALTVVLLVTFAIELKLFWDYIGSQDALGVDLNYYRFVAQRWLDTGVWYTDRQIAGPYETQTLVDNLYPPHALYLFLPWIWLPFPLWWLVPAALVAFAIWRLRPAAWAWPVIALILALPKTSVSILYGNSDMLVLAAVAGGVVWGWPGIVATFKPSMGLFALVGIHRRSWWIAAVALAAVSLLPQLSLWLQWPTVVLNSSATFEYSLANYPFMALPLVIRLASTTAEPIRWPSFVTRTLRLGPRPSRP